MNGRVIDVRTLPTYAFGHRSVLWWATMGLIAIEGTMFALLIAAYVYLRGRNVDWPPSGPPPDLFWAVLNTAILVVSLIPNQLVKMAAERLDLRKVQLWMVICVVFGVAFNVVRIYEFRHLNVWWDQNAYGSVVWTLLGFHTVHILTDFADTAVLAVLMFVGPLEERRFVDVSENSLYWYFVVGAWVPIFVVIYVLPRIW